VPVLAVDSDVSSGCLKSPSLFFYQCFSIICLPASIFIIFLLSLTFYSKGCLGILTTDNSNFTPGKIIIMGVWRQIAEYLYIKKRDPNEPRTQWMKYMHGMNRISILIFLIAIIIMIVRLVIIPMFR